MFQKKFKGVEPGDPGGYSIALFLSNYPGKARLTTVERDPSATVNNRVHRFEFLAR